MIDIIHTFYILYQIIIRTIHEVGARKDSIYHEQYTKIVKNIQFKGVKP